MKRTKHILHLPSYSPSLCSRALFSPTQPLSQFCRIYTLSCMLLGKNGIIHRRFFISYTPATQLKLITLHTHAARSNIYIWRKRTNTLKRILFLLRGALSSRRLFQPRNHLSRTTRHPFGPRDVIRCTCCSTISPLQMNSLTVSPDNPFRTHSSQKKCPESLLRCFA
jgi:hypothetical protein